MNALNKFVLFGIVFNACIAGYFVVSQASERRASVSEAYKSYEAQLKEMLGSNGPSQKLEQILDFEKQITEQRCIQTNEPLRDEDQPGLTFISFDSGFGTYSTTHYTNEDEDERQGNLRLGLLAPYLLQSDVYRTQYQGCNTKPKSGFICPRFSAQTIEEISMSPNTVLDVFKDSASKATAVDGIERAYQSAVRPLELGDDLDEFMILVFSMYSAPKVVSSSYFNAGYALVHPYRYDRKNRTCYDHPFIEVSSSETVSAVSFSWSAGVKDRDLFNDLRKNLWAELEKIMWNEEAQ